MPRSFRLEQIMEASENQSGFCISCGAERDCCEPDARGYPCDDCGKDEVYGAEECAVMGLVK